MTLANVVTVPAACLIPEVLSSPVAAETVRGFKPWKDFVNSNFPQLEHRNHSTSEFQAEVGAYNVAGSALTTINVSASEVIRTKHLAEQADAGFIKLMWQMAGDMQLDQDGRQCFIGAGQAAVCDTARPYRICISDHAHFAVLMLPYDALPGWESISQRICGVQLTDDVTMRATLAALMALRGVEDGGSADTVLKAMQWMLAASLHRSAATMGGGGTLNARLSRAQQHILRNIGNPDLDADALAAALCMSRRSLYMLFKEYKLTPVKMIHDLRLQGTMQVLGDANQHHRKITDIAFDHGFNDYATFSRLFKSQYGMTPSEYRQKLSEPGKTLGKAG